MRISLWQEFSSNHSAHFTIVGEFQTRAQAQGAVDEITSILKTITAWHEAHEEEEQEWWDNAEWVEEPSLIEEELARQYNIEWPGTIDWFWTPQIEIVMDRFVFIKPGMRPESSGKPFDTLMDRLGGKGYLESYVYGDTVGIIIFDLVCGAPDEAAAVAIRDAYLGFNRRIFRNGRYLHFDRWRFDERPDLPKLVKDLQARGCVDVGFALRQVDPEYEHHLHDASDLEIMLDVLRKVHGGTDRRDAADFLGELGDVRAVEPLIDMLEMPEREIRARAAWALGAIGDRRAVAPLLELLEPSDRWTRLAIIGALRRLRDACAIEPLIKTLEDPNVWEEATHALVSIGEPAREALLRTLSQAEPGVFRDRVTRVLERFGER